jgi:hypothetical protein
MVIIAGVLVRAFGGVMHSRPDQTNLRHGTPIRPTHRRAFLNGMGAAALTFKAAARTERACLWVRHAIFAKPTYPNLHHQNAISPD